MGKDEELEANGEPGSVDQDMTSAKKSLEGPLGAREPSGAS